jgi:hypothetical protein
MASEEHVARFLGVASQEQRSSSEQMGLGASSFQVF